MTTVATATVLGGLFPTNGVNSLASMSGEDGQTREISQNFNTRGQLAERALVVALLGAVAGGTALKNISRVVAAVELGGARPIETIALINRATTAADITQITNDYLTQSTRTTFGANPPPNLDRNPLGTR
jgi:hypothetical protein